MPMKKRRQHKSKTVLVESKPRPQKVQFPLIVSKGPKVNLTNQQIYEHIEFP